MLDELQALGLLGLIVCQYLLIRGCVGIKEGINDNGGSITQRLEATTDLLDEMAQLISDLGDSVPAGAPAAIPESPFGMILNSLLNSNSMGAKHGTTQERSVYEIDENPPTNQTED